MPHGVLQARIVAALGAWAEDSASGIAASEWDFRLRQPDFTVDALVPDVAYLSYERAGVRGIENIPSVAPDLAVEIRSPDESAKRRELKVERYLAAGTLVVLDVDPQAEVIAVYRLGRAPEVLAKDERFTDARLLGFALDLSMIFAPIRRR